MVAMPRREHNGVACSMNLAFGVASLSSAAKPLLRYKVGLRDDIRKDLLTIQLASVEEAAYQIAVRVE